MYTYISFRAIVIQNGPHSDRSPRVFQFRMQTTGAAAVHSASHRLYLFSFRRGKIISRHEVTYRPYFGARPSSSWNQGQYSTKVVLCERNYLSSWMTRLHCANYSNRSIAPWKISDPFLVKSIVSSCSKRVKFLKGSRIRSRRILQREVCGLIGFERKIVVVENFSGFSSCNKTDSNKNCCFWSESRSESINCVLFFIVSSRGEEIGWNWC